MDNTLSTLVSHSGNSTLSVLGKYSWSYPILPMCAVFKAYHTISHNF